MRTVRVKRRMAREYSNKLVDRATTILLTSDKQYAPFLGQFLEALFPEKKEAIHTIWTEYDRFRNILLDQQNDMAKKTVYVPPLDANDDNAMDIDDEGPINALTDAVENDLMEAQAAKRTTADRPTSADGGRGMKRRRH